MTDKKTIIYDTFIKGKGALSGVDTFSIVKSDEGCEVVIGYSSTNTNRVNIPTESESCDIDTPITFNANLFKEVLVANRECSSAILEVSTEGLARVNFFSKPKSLFASHSFFIFLIAVFAANALLFLICKFHATYPI